MVELQGLRIAIGWAAFVLALTTVNAMGLPAMAGVQLDAGGADAEQVRAISGNFTEPSVEAVGSEDPGFFGIATSITRTLGQLYTILVTLSPALMSWGVPAPLAIMTQTLVDLSFGLALIQVIRGFRA